MSEIVWLEIECDKSTCGNCQLCEQRSDNPTYTPIPHCWAFEVDLDRNKDGDPMRCGACVLNAGMKSNEKIDNGLRAAVEALTEKYADDASNSGCRIYAALQNILTANPPAPDPLAMLEEMRVALAQRNDGQWSCSWYDHADDAIVDFVRATPAAAILAAHAEWAKAKQKGGE